MHLLFEKVIFCLHHWHCDDRQVYVKGTFQLVAHLHNLLHCGNPFYPEYDSSRSYPFYPEYDFGRSLHLARLPRTLTFWNPIGWLTPNDVSISGSLGNPYFSTNQCRSLGICRTNRAPPSKSEIKDGVESQRSLNVDVF